MARSCNDSTSNKLEYAGNPITIPNFTMAGWLKTTNLQSYGIIGLDDSGAGNTQCQLVMDSSGRCSFRRRENGLAVVSAITTTGVNSATEWNHFCGVSWASDEAYAYLNGKDKTANTADHDLTGMDTLTLGIVTTIWQTRNPGVAHCALWDDSLLDGEVAQLAAGANPLTIRPEALVAYWPLDGTSDGDEVDVVNGYVAVETGSMLAFGDNPPVEPIRNFSNFSLSPKTDDEPIIWKG